MIIDSPNELRQWLTGYLTPLCDADPEVLAKYCIALVKKDRSDDELKKSLMEQLDVFLKSNTTSFVEKFLEVTNNKSYMSKEKSPPKIVSADDVPKAVTSSNSPTRVSAIEPPPPPPPPPTGVSEKSAVTTADSSSQPPLPPLPPPVQSIPYPPPETTPPYPPPPAKKEDFPLSSVKSIKSEPKEREREERRGRRGSRPRDKSRSRSRERERRRSRSRGRTNRSKYDDRRRRSPHRGGSKRYSRRSRSRSRSPRWSRSPNRRSRSRDRRSRSRNRSRSLSPKKRASRKSRSRTPKATVSRAESPVSSSRKTPNKEEKEGSASPDPASTEPKASPPVVLSVVSIPHQERYTSTKSQRCRDYDEQGFCMKGDQCPFDHGADPVVLEGGTIDFPPPLTGVPALTSVAGIGFPLTGPALPRDIQGRGFLRHPPPTRPPTQFGEYTPNNPGLWGNEPPLLPAAPFYGGRGRGMAGPPPRFPGPPPPLPPQDISRELINVPVNGTNAGKTGIRASLAQRLGPASGNSFPSNGAFSVNSVSHGTVKYGNSSENCTLELRKIPNGLNTIAHLNQHFAKFGTITNIQVHHEGDPDAALVTFSTNSEANAAYRSTEAVLNNRFIKLFWHSPSSKKEVPSSTTTSLLQRTVHERLSGALRNPNKSLNNKVQSVEAVPSETEKVILTKGNLIKTVFNPSALKANSQSEPMEETTTSVVMTTKVEKVIPMLSKPVPPDSTQHQLTSVEIKKRKIEAIRKQQDLLRAEILVKQKAQKQKAEALKLRIEIESRTRQLLKEQMQHVKLLINKLETNRSLMKQEEIKILLNTIKSLQNAVDATKAQLASCQTPTPPAPPQPKTKAQLEKEILDTELELYTIQSEGGDITKIRIRVQQLKSQMYLFKGIKHPKPYALAAARAAAMAKHIGRGRGQLIRGRGRGRGRPYGGIVNAVDRRSTCINASGFEREDKEEVLTHFAGLGSVTTYSWDNLTPAITVQYATRREAEKAMNEGRNLGDRLLTLTWVSEPSSGISNQPVIPTTSAISSASDVICLQKTLVSNSAAAPRTTSVVPQDDDVEEITEEIVEEVETTEGYIYDEEIEEEEEEEEEEGEEEGTRSWRR